MRARFASTLAVVLAAAALLPVSARADGDPASDVLLGENVFYPYTPPVSASLTKTLNAEAAAAAKAGFPIKVALIASPVDLGVIPDLFNKPQKYAEFLDQEISFQTKQPLLVVMPAGFGAASLPPGAQKAVARLAKPAGKQSSDLAAAALPAIRKLADAAGHPLKGSGSGSGSGAGSSSTVILIVLVVAALAVIGLLLANRRRRARAAA
ncbi:MAG: hypothetical protein ACXVQR_04245 [Solirubrobacteraceae bacterium]